MMIWFHWLLLLCFVLLLPLLRFCVYNLFWAEDLSRDLCAVTNSGSRRVNQLVLTTQVLLLLLLFGQWQCCRHDKYLNSCVNMCEPDQCYYHLAPTLLACVSKVTKKTQQLLLKNYILIIDKKNMINLWLVYFFFANYAHKPPLGGFNKTYPIPEVMGIKRHAHGMTSFGDRMLKMWMNIRNGARSILLRRRNFL